MAAFVCMTQSILVTACSCCKKPTHIKPQTNPARLTLFNFLHPSLELTYLWCSKVLPSPVTCSSVGNSNQHFMVNVKRTLKLSMKSRLFSEIAADLNSQLWSSGYSYLECHLSCFFKMFTISYRAENYPRLLQRRKSMVFKISHINEYFEMCTVVL